MYKMDQVEFNQSQSEFEWASSLPRKSNDFHGSLLADYKSYHNRWGLSVILSLPVGYTEKKNMAHSSLFLHV